MEGSFFSLAAMGIATPGPGITRQAALAGRAMMTFFTFAPGSVVPLHDQAHDQLSVVVRGRAEFTADSATRVLGSGEGVRLPGGMRHGVRILEAETEIWDAWAPPREEYLMEGS